MKRNAIHQVSIVFLWERAPDRECTLGYGKHSAAGAASYMKRNAIHQVSIVFLWERAPARECTLGYGMHSAAGAASHKDTFDIRLTLPASSR
jgi:hypothetical protein